MSIRTKCSGCGQAFQAPEAMAGKSGKCPKCGAKLQVPTLEAASARSSSTANSGSALDLPEMASWADEILGELPASSGLATAGSPSLSAANPNISPLGPPPSVSGVRGGYASLLTPVFRNLGFAGFMTVCLSGSLAYTLYRHHPFVAIKLAITGIPLVVCLWIASRSKRTEDYSEKRLAMMRSNIWSGVFEWNVITSVWTVIALLIIGMSVLYFIAGVYQHSKRVEEMDYGMVTIAFLLLVGKQILGSIMLYIFGAIILVICRCLLFNLETGKGFMLIFFSIYYFMVLAAGVIYSATVPGEFDFSHPLASSGLNRFSSSSPFGNDFGGSRSLPPGSTPPSIDRTPAGRPTSPSQSRNSGSGFLSSGASKQKESGANSAKVVPSTRGKVAPHKLTGLELIKPGILATTVTLPEIGDQPGSGMRLFVYVPEGPLPDESTACVFIAPSGSNGLHGMQLKEKDRLDHIPFVNAGLIVVAYEVDGALPVVSPTADQAAASYRKYSDARGGITNARMAKKFALENIPAINPRQLIAAGQGSAANLAAAWSAEESQISRVVLIAPIVNMYDKLKDSLLDLQKNNPEYRDARSLLMSMSPTHTMIRLHRPLYIFQSKDDEIADFSANSETFEKLRRLGRALTIETIDSGGHHDSAVQNGWPGAVRWLQKSLNEASQDVPSDFNNLSRNSTSTKTPTAGSPSGAGSGIEYGAPDYNSRRLPFVRTAEDDARYTRMDFILGDDESAKSRIRWSPGRQCPDVITLWCVGLSVSGGPVQRELRWARDLRNTTGPIGEDVFAGIEERSGRAQFGEWPLFAHSSHDEPLLMSGSEKNLPDSARKAGADGLVQLIVEISFIGLNRTPKSTIVAKVIDLQGQATDWESTKLTSRTATEATTSEFTEAILTRIDEQFLLESLDETLVDRDWVMSRIRELLRKKNEGELLQPPLAFLCEFRYYLARDLITKEEGEKTCELFFGSGSWKRFFQGDWESRMSALQLAKYTAGPVTPKSAE